MIYLLFHRFCYDLYIANQDGVILFRDKAYKTSAMSKMSKLSITESN